MIWSRPDSLEKCEVMAGFIRAFPKCGSFIARAFVELRLYGSLVGTPSSGWGRSLLEQVRKDSLRAGSRRWP